MKTDIVIEVAMPLETWRMLIKKAEKQNMSLNDYIGKQLAAIAKEEEAAK